MPTASIGTEMSFARGAWKKKMPTATTKPVPSPGHVPKNVVTVTAIAIRPMPGNSLSTGTNLTAATLATPISTAPAHRTERRETWGVTRRPVDRTRGERTVAVGPLCVAATGCSRAVSQREQLRHRQEPVTAAE
jgi:hypothetical protein